MAISDRGWLGCCPGLLLSPLGLGVHVVLPTGGTALQQFSLLRMSKSSNCHADALARMCADL